MPVSAETPTPFHVRKHGTRTRLASPRLSVVMPVFNEIATIDEIIPRVLGIPLSVELIVVDDCSTDGTRQRLDALQREYGFNLLLQERNQGKGAALRRGFAAVTGNIVAVQDADLEYSPEELAELAALIIEGRVSSAVIECSSSRTTSGTGFSRS